MRWERRIDAVSRVSTIAVVIIIVALAGAGFYFYMASSQNLETTTCAGCFYTQPIVEVVIPKLAGGSNPNGATNSQLNVSSGQSVTLSVSVYPTVPLTVEMEFRLYASTNTTGNFVNASFTPSRLAIPSQGNGTTTMTLSFSDSAPAGTYSAVVTAVDSENSSLYWGSYFQILVTS